ncbi:hypothetical protein [Streptomyces narbonensis]|uniref:hypothetical protein n=1 Tax=Streptomyces narbonensis TaxID=67333 RepID=UPI0034067C28
MNVVKGNGKVHHNSADDVSTPACNPWQGVSGFKGTDRPVDCKKCLLFLERAAEAAKAAESAIIVAEGDTNGEKDTMAETTTQEAPAEDVNGRIVEEVQAATERAASLVEAENLDALAELSGEVETMISKLPTRGKGPDGKSWTGVKKDLRTAFAAAAQAQEKPAPKAPAKKAAVAKKADAAPATPVVAFDDIEGVPALVAEGAAQAAEGVRLNLKTSSTAQEVAVTGLKIWLKIPNKDGNPDLMGDSDTAKKASTAMKNAIGKQIAEGDASLDAFDVEKAVKSMWRAVQNQRQDVRAMYLRALDLEDEQAEEQRALFAKILEGKPEEVPASKWVADHYGADLVGPTELARQRYHEKKELGKGEGGGDGEEVDEETKALEAAKTADEHLLALAAKLAKDVLAAKPEEVEKASEAAKDSVRDVLEEVAEALKKLRKAVL